MAELARSEVTFAGRCPDCGERRAVLPPPLPAIEDDFDWLTRDYDSFRLFLMQELAHRFPERSRWTVADMEVVIVEVLAAALDRASQALDAIQAERYLETARRPESVRRLLKLIGYDATEHCDAAALGTSAPTPQMVEDYWRKNPLKMEEARTAGPALIGEQQRMVTLEDHAIMLGRHPLVARARARLLRGGGWTTILITTLLEGYRDLDRTLSVTPADAPSDGDPDRISSDLWNRIVAFHQEMHLGPPVLDAWLTPRRLLNVFLERYRMVGSEILLAPARSAPITLTLAVRAKRGYFRSELSQELNAVLTSDEGGFFEPGRLGFGESLYASDLVAAVVAVEGVETVCMNRFKRVGGAWPDRTADEFIPVEEDELILCMNRSARPGDGTYRLIIEGGELG